VRFGREANSTVTVLGDAAKVVSARHAELRVEGNTWLLADLGSRNGTFLNGKRVTGPTPVGQGDVIRLGESGPEYRVAAIAGSLDATLPEHPGIQEGGEGRGGVAEVRAYGVTLLATATGKRYDARGTRIRLGRGRECEVQPVAANDTIVSRIHAELTVGATGGLVVRDAESKNGTYLNGEHISKPMPIRLGDKIMLGQGGPVLLVEGMGTAPQRAALGQKTVVGLIGQALAKAREERKKGGRGSTAFMRAVAEEVGKDSRRKIRSLTAIVIVLILLLGGGVYGVYWLLSRQVEHTNEAMRTAEDSSRAEGDRLRRELTAARAAAAPAAQVDSLRVQLAAAESRTSQLQVALDRAQQALGQQLAAGESQRQEGQRDLQRMRDQLAAAERRAPSQESLDSLRRAVATAESQAATLDAKLRAIRGTDFAGMAQQNQGAVGLVTVALGGDRYDGTGFVISADGYMLELARGGGFDARRGRHGVGDDGGPIAGPVRGRHRHVARARCRTHQNPRLSGFLSLGDRLGWRESAAGRAGRLDRVSGGIRICARSGVGGANLDDGRNSVASDARFDSVRRHDNRGLVRKPRVQRRWRSDFRTSRRVAAGTGIRALGPGEIRDSAHAACAAPAARPLASCASSRPSPPARAPRPPLGCGPRKPERRLQPARRSWSTTRSVRPAAPSRELRNPGAYPQPSRSLAGCHGLGLLRRVAR
jgi:pSer/pThr/pTyr-binding forkhead associated (FHA) protein